MYALSAPHGIANMNEQEQNDKFRSIKVQAPPGALGSRYSAIGTVKWCRDDKGYGAIVVEGFEPWDIWYHYTSIEVRRYAISQSGERIEVTRDTDGSLRLPSGEIYSGSTESAESKILLPGERVVVDFRRIDQESFRYVAERVRRLDYPRGEERL